MASMAGSKGAFVGSDSDIDRLRKLRLDHDHVLALQSYKIDSKQKICAGSAASATNINDDMTTLKKVGVNLKP